MAPGPSSDASRGTVVIGVGASAAGDDGVGFSVIEELRSVVPGSTRLACVSEPSGLLPLLEGEARVVIVDAAVDAGPPGAVQCTTADGLDFAALDRMSTHGFGVGGVLRLAEAMSLVRLDEVYIVAIAIDRPPCPRFGLSPPVSAAVGEAVRAVLRIVARVSTGAAAAAGSQ